VYDEKNANLNSFASWLDEIKKQAAYLDSDPRLVRTLILALFDILRAKASTAIPLTLSNDELETLFSVNAALAFTIWQHLVAIERLNDADEWKEKNSLQWDKIETGRRLCGLATTHLNKSTGLPLKAHRSSNGFLLDGIAPWSSGYGIFDDLIIGFDSSNEVGSALIAYPKPNIQEVGMTVTPRTLGVFNTTSSISIVFQNYFLQPETLINVRNKANKAKPRKSSYYVPDIGIAKAALKLIRVERVNATEYREGLHQLEATLNKFENTRAELIKSGQPVTDQLLYDKDELNRAAVRLLFLINGASCLGVSSEALRLHGELLLSDVLIHSPELARLKVRSLFRV
jgi:hypothetical protein